MTHAPSLQDGIPGCTCGFPMVHHVHGYDADCRCPGGDCRPVDGPVRPESSGVVRHRTGPSGPVRRVLARLYGRRTQW